MVFGFEPRNSSQAYVFAQREIGRIKEKNKAALKQLEETAAGVLKSAVTAKDVKTLEAFIQKFPNTDSFGDGLLALAGLYLEQGKADQARHQYQRFLFTFRDSPRTAEAMANLALAFEKAGMMSSSKSTLLKLTRLKTLADQDVAIQGKPAQKAGAWAEARLKEPIFQTPASSSVRRLGNGKLNEAWNQSSAGNVVFLQPEGKPAGELQRALLAVENNNEIVVRSGKSGDEIWKPRPKTPNGFQPGAKSRAAWADDVLILAGTNEVVGFDHKTSGKELWKHALSAAVEAGGGPVTSLNVSERHVVLAQQGGMLTVIDGATGAQVWKTQVEGGQIFGEPAVGEGFIAVGTINPAPQKVTLFELETGLRRLDVQLPSGRLVKGPVCAGETLYVVTGDNKLVAFGTNDGKARWEYQLDSAALYLDADHEHVMAVESNLTLVVCDPTSADPQKVLKWKAKPDVAGQFGGLTADGEDVFMAVHQAGRKGGQVFAYHARGGKIKWKADLAGVDLLTSDDLAQEHLLLMQSGFDPQGQAASQVGVIQRKSGVLKWAQTISSGKTPSVGLFDGGVAIADGRKITGFLAQDSERVKEDTVAIHEAVKQNPADLNLKLQLATVQFDNREYAKAFETMRGVLDNPAIDEATFAAAYERLSRFRRQLPREQRPVFRLARVTEGPKLDGTLDSWKNIPATALDNWDSVYLSGESDARVPVKKGEWTGKADCSASFRGAWDDKHAYLCVVVTDDVHKNTNKPIDLWNGDSVQFAFDMELDTRRGYFGNDSEVGLALTGDGAQLAFRWVERGKYIMKPLETPAKTVRNEAGKQTIYQLALPLDVLGLKGAAGTKFGFTFMVNDLDKGENTEKGLAPSQGIWDPKSPGQYATAELVEAK